MSRAGPCDTSRFPALLEGSTLPDLRRGKDQKERKKGKEDIALDARIGTDWRALAAVLHRLWRCDLELLHGIPDRYCTTVVYGLASIVALPVPSLACYSTILLSFQLSKVQYSTVRWNVLTRWNVRRLVDCIVQYSVLESGPTALYESPFSLFLSSMIFKA